MKNFAVLVPSLFLLTFSMAVRSAERLELTIGMYRIDAEVVADQQSRMQGLMDRHSMAQQQGMLFVFPEVELHCMWMRNTHIPLSVAFIDKEGRIINIEDMQPHTENSHCAAKPVRYALEMNRSWFATKGIKPGARFSGFKQVPAPR